MLWGWGQDGFGGALPDGPGSRGGFPWGPLRPYRFGAGEVEAVSLKPGLPKHA